MEIQHLHHKHGGRITSITSIGHSTDQGRAFWFYVGNVEWDDGGKSESLEIAPWAVCYESAQEGTAAEYDKLADMLSDYMRRNGQWKERKKGYPYAWVPKVGHSYETLAA